MDLGEQASVRAGRIPLKSRDLIKRKTVYQGVDRMEYDQEKVDEMTLALLYLVTTEREEGLGARAWKGFDWDTMVRLHEKGWIDAPKIKSMSFYITEDGFKKSEQLFLQHFGKKEK